MINKLNISKEVLRLNLPAAEKMYLAFFLQNGDNEMELEDVKAALGFKESEVNQTLSNLIKRGYLNIEPGRNEKIYRVNKKIFL